MSATVVSLRPALAQLSLAAGRGTRAVLAVLSLSLVALLAFLQLDQIRDDRRIGAQVTRAWKNETALLRFIALQQDVETGQRGYVLTGQTGFLQPFTAARSATDRSLAELRRAFGDNPAGLRRLSDLEALTERKLLFAARTIDLRRRGDSPTATALIASGEGVALMEQMKTTVRDMIASEQSRLIGLQADAAKARQRAQFIAALAQLESGKVEFEIAPLNVAEVLRESVQANAGYAAGHGVSLTTGPVPERLYLLADRDRLLQVMDNLISNAAKFSAKGGAVVLGAEDRQHHVRITVSDSGRGIPDSFHDRIFSRFAQAESSDARDKGGTGLGLAIVKEIVTRMNGDVSFDSTLGLGTTFHVDLPRHWPEP